MSSHNPLLQATGYPQFDVIKPEHVMPAMDQLLTQAEARLTAIEESSPATWDDLIPPLEELDLPFDYGWGPVSHLFGVLNSDELREAYEQALEKIVAFNLRVGQSEPIYRGLLAIRAAETWSDLDEAQQRIIDQRIRSAEHSGIALQGEQRQRFNDIAQSCPSLSTDFSNHVLDAVRGYELVLTERSQVEGFPESLLRMTASGFNQQENSTGDATPEDGPWRVSLEVPVFVPFMQHCRDRSLREQVYRAFVTRASNGDLDNAPLIRKILRLRQEKARLLGYDTYGELSLASKMAPDVTGVQSMLETTQDGFVASRS